MEREKGARERNKEGHTSKSKGEDPLTWIRWLIASIQDGSPREKESVLFLKQLSLLPENLCAHLKGKEQLVPCEEPQTRGGVDRVRVESVNGPVPIHDLLIFT